MTVAVYHLPVRPGAAEIARWRRIEQAAHDVLADKPGARERLREAVHGPDAADAVAASDAEVEDLRAGGLGEGDPVARLMAKWVAKCRDDAS